MGKEFKKINDTFVCIIESLCWTTETDSALLINYTPIYNLNFLIQKGLKGAKKIIKQMQKSAKNNNFWRFLLQAMK